MGFHKYKYDSQKDKEFAKILRKRVNEYFTNNKLSKFADFRMVSKTILVYTMLFVPYFILISGIATESWMSFTLWAIMGVGTAGIGLNVMHDAIHGGYSESPALNRLLSISMNIIGGNAYVWHMQHNVLHHTYPNIEEADDDIDIPFLLRMTPHQKQYWFHRYQQVYVWILYSLATVFWVTTKDFGQLDKYRRRGLLSGNGELLNRLINIIFWKLVYYGYLLVIPLYIAPFDPIVTISGFILMHLIAGVFLSIIFQPAHVFTGSEYLQQDYPEIDKSWIGYQLQTTTNFELKGFMKWIAGGLNYQVEHHLFPNICHVHYEALSPIVMKTAKEFGLPYYSQPNHIQALFLHFDQLRELGKKKSIENLHKAA